MKEVVFCWVGVVVVLVIGAVGAHVRADEYRVFVETFGGNANEVGLCTSETSDGGFVMTGYTDGGVGGKDVFFVKADAQGNVLEKYVYGGGQDEEGRCVLEMHDGGFLVVGYTKSLGDGADLLISRFHSDGSFDWTRTWGGEVGRDEELYSVVESADQILWLTGFSRSTTLGGWKEVLIAQLDATDAHLTGVSFGKVDWDFSGQAIVAAPDGVVVAGSATGPLGEQSILLLGAGEDTSGSWDVIVQWRKRIESADWVETGFSLTGVPDGGFALSQSVTDVSGGQAGYLLRLDPSADLEWGRSIAGDWQHPKTIKGVTQTQDGSVVVIGGYVDGLLTHRVVGAKFSLSGDQVWSRGLVEADGSMAHSVVEIASQCLLTVGSTGGYGMAQDEVLLAKLCSAGKTCLDDVEGPSFSVHLPSEIPILVSSQAEFVVSTAEWNHLFSAYVFQMGTTPVCASTTYTVCPDGPADFRFIQDAIDAASNGDIIELCDATFVGERNRNLDFQGKCITVRSQSGNRDACVIDCNHDGRGFYFHNEEGCHSIVEGITIRNGAEIEGGAVACEKASPTLTTCRFEDCHAYVAGGAIHCANASPTVDNCEILDCTSDDVGGGINISAGSPTLLDCRIACCYSPTEGGGIHCQYSAPTITGSSITGNHALWGGGIYVQASDPGPRISQCTLSGNFADYGGAMLLWVSQVEVTNTILWGDCAGAGDEVWCQVEEGPPSSDISFRCCDVDDLKIEGHCSVDLPGDNINADPLFCDARDCLDAPTCEGDYGLRPGSPCLPEQQPVCGLIGALGEGCECTWTIYPDGSGDFETIQDAIDAAWDGVVICLADGTFYGPGNRDISWPNKAITIRSLNGPDNCTVDCSLRRISPHRGFYFHSGAGPDAVLEGVTIINGSEYVSGSCGGGILCVDASPTITNCRIKANSAYDGGAICCKDDASPTITDCVITGNSASHDGGGIYVESSSPDLFDCTISGNRAGNRGGGVYHAGGQPFLENTILRGDCASTGIGDEWYCESGSYGYCCSDVDEAGVDASMLCAKLICPPGKPNIDADPLFCDPEDCENAPTPEGDYHICDDSPCADDPYCGLIGALEVGCSDIVYVRSCYDHAGTEYCLQIGCDTSGLAPHDNVEPRLHLGAAPTLRLRHCGFVNSATVAVSCTPNAYGGTASVNCDGSSTATVTFSGVLPDESCCTLTFSGDIVDERTIVMLEGDVDRDCFVTTADGSSITQRLGQPKDETNFWYDVDRDCAITTADGSAVTGRLGNMAPCPCSCP